MTEATLEIATSDFIRLRDRIRTVFRDNGFGTETDHQTTCITDDDCAHGGSRLVDLLEPEEIPFRLTWGNASEYDAGSAIHLPGKAPVEVDVVDGECIPIVRVRDGEINAAELQAALAYGAALRAFHIAVAARPPAPGNPVVS